MKSFKFFISVVQFLSLAIANAGSAELTAKPYEVVWQFNYNEGEAEAVHLQKLSQFKQIARESGWNVAVVKTLSQTLANYKLTSDESLADVVVNKLKGCKSFDEKCRQVIANLNRRDLEEISDVGPLRNEVLSLPAQYTQYLISIDAGSAYRVKTENRKTTAVISSRLANATKLIEESKHAVARMSRACVGSTCWTFETIVE